MGRLSFTEDWDVWDTEQFSDPGLLILGRDRELPLELHLNKQSVKKGRGIPTHCLCSGAPTEPSKLRNQKRFQNDELVIVGTGGEAHMLAMTGMLVITSWGQQEIK